MYCGSCMHDNALAAALLKLGCDAALIPTYTPIRTDEQDVSSETVFFGGINVFLRERYAWYRWLPGFITHFLDGRGLLNLVGKWGINTSGRDLGRLTVSMLRGERGPVRKEVLRLVDWLVDVHRPHVINLSNMLIGGCIPELRRRLPETPILVTLQGDDLFLNDLPTPYREQALQEIARLAESVDGFLVNSDYYAEYMAELLGLARDRFRKIPLGLNVNDFRACHAVTRRYLNASTGTSGPQDDEPLHVGYLARICPAKGLHLLVEAWLLLRSKPGMERVRLRVAGWLGAGDKQYFERAVQRVQGAGAANDFEHLGVLGREQKIEFLAGLDVLSVPTTYREPKGLYVLESLAAGTPVVQPAHGAFPELLAATDGGVLVPPNDPVALAAALHELLSDAAKRQRLGIEGQNRVLTDFNSREMAEKTLAVYREFLASRRTNKPA